MNNVFISFLILLSFITIFSFKCGHEELFRNRTLYPPPNEFNEITSHSFVNSADEYADINIYVDYASINVKKLVNANYVSHLKTGLTKTTKAISSLLGVNTHYNMKFDEMYLHQCDNNLILSPELKEGVSAVSFYFLSS